MPKLKIKKSTLEANFQFSNFNTFFNRLKMFDLFLLSVCTFSYRPCFPFLDVWTLPYEMIDDLLSQKLKVPRCFWLWLQGILVFASVMATLGLQIILESSRTLISKVKHPPLVRSLALHGNSFCYVNYGWKCVLFIASYLFNRFLWYLLGVYFLVKVACKTPWLSNLVTCIENEMFLSCRNTLFL